MALVLLDRARETTIVAGTTASAILLGAVSGYQSLAGVGNGNTTYYCIADQTGANWEVGIGTYTLATTTLTRAATPLDSSNAGASVVFPAGTKDVFVTYPAEKGVWLDASGNAIGLGTPAAFIATNVTGLPISTGVSGLAANIATFLATPSSANLFSALTDETGTGLNVFATSPTLVTPILGTPTSGTLTSCTGLPLTTGVTGTLPIANGGTNSTATPTAGGAGYGTGTAHAYTAAGTSGNALISAGASAPAFGNLALGTANTNVSGALTATNGGTGVAGTLTGVLYGNGISAHSVATAAQMLTGMGVANTTTSGYLSSTDWNTFNGKQAAGSYVTVGGALGTPSSGTVTNLTGTASININGTVGATTANSGEFTTVTASSNITANGRVIGTSPNSGSTGAVTLKNAVADPDTLYIQAINNAGTIQYSALQFKTDGSISASGQITATQFNGAWQYLPSGTRMSFQQTAAPTGWTKDTTAAINNSACRFVTGTASSGGSVGFTTAFASQAVTGTNGASAAYTLATADIPSHSHVVTGYQVLGGGGLPQYSASATNASSPSTGETGGGGSHSHGAASFTGNAINLAVKYYDFIIASKN